MTELKKYLKIPSFEIQIIVFCFITYLGVNSQFFTQPYQETGDFAANALQIERATKGEETLGSYSRFVVNHPGPITFYVLAFFQKILVFPKSIHGAHLIGICFYNLFFILITISLLRQVSKNRLSTAYLLFGTLLGLGNLLPNFFSNLWGPGFILFPVFLFIVSVIGFILGKPNFLFWMIFSSSFIIQNQIVAISFIVPLFLVGLYHHYNIFKFEVIKQKRSIVWVLLGTLFTLIVWLPPFMEEFTHSPGNLTNVILLAIKNTTFNKPGPVLKYVFSYYSGPFMFSESFPTLLFVGFLFGIPFFNRNRLESFDRMLLKILIWSFFITLFGAFKMKGGLIPHVYWFTYILSGFWFYLCLKVLLYKFELELNRPNQIFLILILVGVVGLYGKQKVYIYDDRPEKILQELALDKNTKYVLHWKQDAKNFEQGDLAIGVLLRMERTGYHGCFLSEWGFLVPENLRCGQTKGLKHITFATPDAESEILIRLDPNTIVYKKNIVRIDQ